MEQLGPEVRVEIPRAGTRRDEAPQGALRCGSAEAAPEAEADETTVCRKQVCCDERPLATLEDEDPGIRRRRRCECRSR